MLAKTYRLTVAQVVALFIAAKQQGASWRHHASVLSGPPSGRVTGRAAAGPTLAQSELGALPMGRVTGDEFVAWFSRRHPSTMSAAARRRGKSSLRQFLVYAVSKGYAAEEVLDALGDIEIRKSTASRGWLRPEQVVALDRVMNAYPFTDAQRFMWRTMLNAGLRVTELVTLTAGDLKHLAGQLKVTGKFDKTRMVPVSDEFRAEWNDYVLRHRLRSTSWMFPLTGVRFGADGQNERVILNARRHADAKAVRSFLEKNEDEPGLNLADAVRAEAAAGRFPVELVPTFRLIPHVLRHTYACNNLIAAALLGAGHGLDLRSLQLSLGHESLETTALYLNGEVADYLNRHRRPVNLTDAARAIIERNAQRQAEDELGEAA